MWRVVHYQRVIRRYVRRVIKERQQLTSIRPFTFLINQSLLYSEHAAVFVKPVRRTSLIRCLHERGQLLFTSRMLQRTVV